MTELREREDTRPPSVRAPVPAQGGQREDVPYHWPRGPEAPTPPGKRRAQRALITLTVVLSALAVALLWYMIARSTRAF